MPAPRITPAPGQSARLVAARQAAGLTQAQLAERLGVTIGRISDAETGRRPMGLEGLCSLARAVGCRPSTLDERLTDKPE